MQSSFEFSGFNVSLSFPPQYLAVSGVDEHTRPGLTYVNDEDGVLGILMASSRRRVGAENERVHIATIYVDIKEEALEVDEVSLSFENVAPHRNLSFIQHAGGLVNPPRPQTSESSPIHVANAVLNVRTDRLQSIAGDLNVDSIINLTDAVLALILIFFHDNVPCPQAADVNRMRR